MGLCFRILTHLGVLVMVSTSALRLTVKPYDEYYVETLRSSTNKLPEELLTQNCTVPPRIQPKFEKPDECSGRPSTQVPSSIHNLRPGDVKVIGSIGDSITAGFGELSRSILDLFNEYRGSAWVSGGDDDLTVLTSLPNLFKTFGSPMYGQSTGSNPVNNPNAGSGLNVAVSGAIARDMPEQVITLIEKMKADRAVNYEEDWKVVSLWIGGNDLCSACNDNPQNQPLEYIRYIEEAIDILLRDMPRVYLNLISIIDITELAEVNQGACSLINSAVCPCGTSSDPTVVERLKRDAKEMQILTEELAKKPEYHSKDDFTVEFQPFLVNSKVPRGSDGRPDLNFFAPDCFHFSRVGHEVLATALWNNMLQAPTEKQTQFVVGERLLCPTDAAPFLCTQKNDCGRQIANLTDTMTF